MKETQRRLINFANTAAVYPFGPKRAFHCTIYKVSTDDSLNEDVRCNFRFFFSLQGINSLQGIKILSQSPCQTGLEQLGLQYKVGFTNSKIVLIVDLSLYLKTRKLLSVFPLFMTNMLSFLRTRLPTISCLYVNHITSNA